MAFILAIGLSVIISMAAATDNSTTTTVGYVSDPDGRGTLSLLWSCLLTMGLCVWSAMHLNIPQKGETETQTWISYIKWGLVGVVAPELVVFAAWRQYNSARALHAEVNKHLNAQQPALSGVDEKDNASKVSARNNSSGSDEQIYQWTMVHSFYAGMGGFVAEPNVSLADGGLKERLTLTARGVALLAKCGHLPNISKQDIEDKSKADGLAKALVCVQAGWMVVQVIGRLAFDLPVTLLEVNILGHVLCALVIYLLWWHKPRLVREPTKLEDDWVLPISAYMYISSQISGWKSPHAGLLQRTWFDPELSALAFFTGQSQNLNIPKEKNLTAGDGQQNISSQDMDLPRQANDKSDASSGGTVDSGHFGPRPLPSDPTGGFAHADSIEQIKTPNTTQITRWRLAADAVSTYPAIRQRFVASHQSGEKAASDWMEPVVEELMTKSIRNWPSVELLRGTGGLIMGMVLWFASMAYGGVHIAAWNYYFPSTFEEWMWRASSLYIAASGLLWLMINLLAQLSKTIDTYWDRVLAFQAHRINYVILGSVCFVCGVMYACARIFLVVEAFISIRELPVAAYETPDWTQVIPHL